MKKRILLIVLLSMCVVVINSCKKEEEKQELESASFPVQETVSTQQTPVTSGELINPDFVEIPSYDIYTLEEYQKFISAQNNLPNDFVPFDDLKQFGKFKKFYCLSDPSKGGVDFSWYQYKVVDESGCELSIAIDHTFEEKNNTTVNQQISSSSSVISNRNVNGFESSSEIKYVYLSSGSLLCIKWKSQGIQYTLGSSGRLEEDYPATTSTLAGKLIYSDNATELLESIFELDSE